MPEYVFIKRMPFKQEYLEGESLDLTGFILCVKYKDGSEREITDMDNGNFIMYYAHTQTGVNLSYEGHPFNIPVIVRKPKEKTELAKMFLSRPPDKQRFIEGEELDFSGAQIILQYSDGTREIVDVTPDMIQSGDCSKPGNISVVIEYKGYKIEEPIVVYEREIDHLEIISPPEKTNYIGNEPVDVHGLVLGVCFDNGDREETIEFSVLPEVSQPGMKYITIAYRDHQVEFPVTAVPVSVTELDWESLPKKRNYFIHEKDFSCTGGVLKVTYNTGEEKNVPLDTGMVSGFHTDQTGQCTIIAEYEGQRLPFTITVQDRLLLGIRMNQMPRTYYMAGERFNPEGMKVETVYSGGVNEEVECTFRPDRPLRTDDNFVVIAYQDKALMLDLVVTEPKLEPEPAQEVVPSEPERELIQEGESHLESGAEPTSVTDSESSEFVSCAAPDSTETVSDIPEAEEAVENQVKEEETVKKVQAPHFYPSTFCIRFQD